MREQAALPAELLGDSEAALRRAADLLAGLGADHGSDHDDAALDSDDATRLLGLSEELRRLREDLDDSAAEVAWCLHEARTLVHDLEKRIARIARFAASAEHATAPAPRPD